MPSFSTLFTPILSPTVPAVLGEHEPEPVFSDLNLVSIAQVDGVDPDAIDVSAVQASDVAYPVPPLPVDYLRVFPRNGDVVEEDAALLPAADRDDIIAKIVHPASGRALHLIHLDQGGAVGAA